MRAGGLRRGGWDDVSFLWRGTMTAIGLAVGAALLAGCRPHAERVELLVFAAASLADGIAEMEQQFEAVHPDVDVVVSIGASSMLARQIERGAPADVFLSASPAWTELLAERGQLRARAQPLVGNRLVVIGRSDAAPLARLDALKRFDRIALADPAHVPAGQYAREGLERAGLWDDLADRIVPLLDVRAAVAAVQTGAAPIGIVYASDVRTISGVRVVLDWPAPFAPSIRYTVAVPATARYPEQAEAFVAFVRDTQAGVWQRYGFSLLDEVQP